MLDTIFSQSLELSFWLQSLGSWLDPVMEFFTFLGEEQFYLLVMPVIIWVIDYQLGFRVGVMLLLTSGINDLFKMSFRLPRPFWTNPEVARASSMPGGYGLPSGHSQTPLSVFGLLAAALKRSWVTAVFIFVIFMIGLSRIYLGVHFYIDVLSGWLLGGLVLFAFLKLESGVKNWFSSKSFWVKTGVVFTYSLVVILIGAAIIAGAGDYQVPHDWLVNAHIAYPEEPLEPLGLNSTITSAAALFGLAVGYFWVNEAGGYNANSGKWWQRALRFVVGLIGVLVLYMGLGEIFPDQQDLTSYLLRYLRYGLIGVWISGIGPRLFIRSKLAEAEND
jgi:membrane-associated phospholipid phosphatase